MLDPSIIIGVGAGALLIGVLIGVGASDDQWRAERERRIAAERYIREELAHRRRTHLLPAGHVADVEQGPRREHRPLVVEPLPTRAHPMFRVNSGYHGSLKAIDVAPIREPWTNHDRVGEDRHGGIVDLVLEHQIGRVVDGVMSGELTAGAVAARRLNENLSGRSGMAKERVA